MIRSALASSRWPPERLRERQEERLGQLLRHAYHAVPLYRNLYNAAGFRPEDFSGLDDWPLVPMLRKCHLQGAPAAELLARGTPLARCVVERTSGSTGEPLRIYLGPHEVCWHRAVAWRILFEHGFRWTDRTLEIRQTFGARFWIQRLSIAPKEWVSIRDPPESWAARLSATRFDVITASASTLDALAQAVQARGLRVPSPRLVVSDSELLLPTARRRITRALGTEPIDVYGLAEVSNFAWECPCREGLHVSADSHLVEVQSQPGLPGAVIVTDLGMWTMPIIRYDTGDIAEAAVAPCACGRTLPRLRRLCGRNCDAVVLPDGRRLFWPFFHETFARFDGLKQWRVRQDEPTTVRVQLVTAGDDMSLVSRVATAVRHVIPRDVRLEVERVDRLLTPAGEKPVMVPSTVAGARDFSTASTDAAAFQVAKGKR